MVQQAAVPADFRRWEARVAEVEAGGKVADVVGHSLTLPAFAHPSTQVYNSPTLPDS